MPNDYELAHQERQKEQEPEHHFGLVIKPPPEQSEEQRAARDVEIQQRGGHLHDTIKIDPFSKSWGKKEFYGKKPITRA